MDVKLIEHPIPYKTSRAIGTIALQVIDPETGKGVELFVHVDWNWKNCFAPKKPGRRITVNVRQLSKEGKGPMTLGPVVG